MATTDFVVKNGLVVTENAIINETTDASSKDTGALIVEGGVGIEKKLYVGTDLSVGGNETLAGDLAINGGDLTTSQATFNLLNTTATTVNFAGAGTNIQIGAATGTTNINNSLDVDGDVNIDGGDLTVSTGTFNLANTTATTVNFAGASTALTIGATSGTTNVRNNLNVTGDLDIDGGDLTVSDTTFNLVNTTATTLNIGGAATNIQIGAATGTTNINNSLDVDGDVNIDGGDLTVSTGTFNLANTTATTVNFAGAGTNIQIGAATGTTNINNSLDVDGDVNIDGGDLTTNQASFNLLNTTATTINFAGAGTLVDIGSATGTTSINNNLAVDGNAILGNSGADSVTFNASTINVPNSVTISKDDAVAASVSYPVSFSHTTSGIPLIGIGTGVEFITETAASNFEIGSVIESITTGVTATNESFDLVFKLMSAGQDASEKIRFTSAGEILSVNNWSLSTNQLTTTNSVFDLINTTATTVNVAGDASTITIGATTGTATIRNATTTITGNANVNGGTLATNQGTFNLVNTTATTVNFAGAATNVQIGAATGTTNINNSLDVDGDVNIDGGDLTVSTSTFNLANTTATTVNFAGASTALTIGAATGTATIRNATTTITGNANVNGGTLATNKTTFNLLNTTATTVNFAGTATDIQIGAATGTTNVNNSLDVDGDVNIDGGDLTVSTGTFNLANTTATSVNFAGAATSLTVGATSGTTNVRNNLNVTGDLDIDGGDLTVSTGTFNLANTTATAVNFAGASTALTIGAATGTATIRNATTTITGNANVNGGTLATNQTTFNLLNTTATTLNIGGASTALTIGAATGTATIRNATTTITGNANVNGGTLATNQGTFNLINTAASTVNAFGAATSLSLGATSGTGSTTIKNSLTVDGNTTLGNASGDAVTFNASTINVPNAITVTQDDAVANGVSYPVSFRHTTSGVPLNGIGTGIQLVTETANNNFETGAIIESVSTDVTDASEDFDLVFKLMAGGAAPVEKFRIGSNGTITVDAGLVLGSGDLNTTQTTFNLVNNTATTVNFAGAATNIQIGSATGTTNINNNLDVDGDINIDGGDLTVSDTIFNLVNTTATTLNIGGAATLVDIGATTGTTSINNSLDVDGDVNIDGGDLTTNQASFNLVNTTATTVNFAKAATLVDIGAATGTTSINNNLSVDGTLFVTGNTTFDGDVIPAADNTGVVGTAARTWSNGQFTNLTIDGTLSVLTAIDLADSDVLRFGSSDDVSMFYNGTDNIFDIELEAAATQIDITDNGTTRITFAKTGNITTVGDVAVNGGDLTTSATTFNLVNTTATTVNLAGAATNVQIGAATGTTNVNNSLDVDGDVNIDGGDLTVSTATFNLANATATTVNFAGAATTLTVGATSGTTNVRNNLNVTGDLDIDGGDLTVSTGTFNLANTTATTVNFAGAATTLEIGAATGTTNVNNNLTVDGNTILGNASGDTVTFNASSILVPNTITTIVDDAFNAGISYPVNLSHTTSGTPVTGIGTGLQFTAETSIGNVEIGALIDAISTDVTAASEDFDLSFKTMAAGAAAAERVNINSSSVTVNTGLINLTNGTSNRIDWNTSGVAAPTFTTRSAGTKLVLYPNITASTVDFALGIESNTLWFSTFNTSGQFKWYGGTTQAMLLSGAGNLTVTGDVAVNGGDLTTNQSTFNLVNTTATTINFGGAANTLNIGKSSGTTVIAGNLTVNGTTTTINTATLTVDDKNIELGSIASPTDVTADGGGITLKGTTDKTFNWVDATDSWTSSEHMDIANGKVYKINQATVLSATALGSGVTSSSLTTVGTIGTGAWQGTIINPTYGGTGINNGGRTITIGGNFTHTGAHNLTLTTTGVTNVTLPTSGTLATTGNLSQFAATTSAQLAGVISDETGSGALVFNTSPTFTTGVLTNSASFAVFNTTATTVNAFGAATTLNVGNSAAAQTVSIGSGSTGASTYNLGTGVTAASTIKTLNMGTGGAASSTTNVNIGSSTGGTTTINSSTLVGAVAAQTVFNTVATTLNIGGAASTFNAGATSGTMTLRNPTIVGSQVTQNLFNTTATTMNFAGAATALTMGAATGTATIRNASVILSGDLQVQGGDLTTNQATFNLVNTTATTVNFAGAGTNIQIGAATGTTNVNNSLDVDGDVNIDGGDLTVSTGTFNLANTTATTVNFAGASTALTIGATTGTTTIRNASTVVTGDLAVNGADITTTTTGASSIFNANTTTLNLAQAATTITMGATTGTTTIRNNLAVSGNSTLGDASGDSITFNSNTINVPNTVLFTVDDGVTNNISRPVKLRHSTTGTPAIGIGTGVEFTTETAANNFEIGAVVDSVSTTVTAGAENFDLIFRTMSGGAVAAERLRITSGGNGIITGNFDVRGGSLTTNQATFNLINATTTTLNVGAAATAFNAGATSGTMTLRNPTIVGSQATQNLFNTTASTLNIGGASSAFNAGATSGTMTLRNPTIVGSQATQNLFNTVATTMNFAGNAAAVTIGATTGTATIRNATTSITGNLTGPNDTVKIKSNIDWISPDSNNTITVRMTDTDTLSFSGNSGQLFSITDSLTGTIFAVNDISGVPSIEVIDDGTIILAELVGNVLVGTQTDNGVDRLQVNGGVSVSGTVSANGGTLATNQTSFNLINTTATTGNLFGASSTVTIGATSGTMTLRNPTIVGSQATQALFNTVATTMNFAGNATAFNAGATSGTMTLRNPTIVGSQAAQTLFNTVATTMNFAGSASTINIGSTAGTMTLRNPTIVGSQAAQTVFNTVATTLNIGGASTAFNAGATSGTMTLRNPTIVGSQATQNLFNTVATTGNLFGAATAITIGATTGTATLRNASVILSGDLQVQGGDLTTNQTTFNLINTTSTTVNAFGAATAITIGANNSGTATIRNNSTVLTGRLTVNGNNVTMAASSTRDKYRVWNDSTYTIGMHANYTFGSLNNDYAMTFQMSNTDARGFWWGDASHNNAQGAMALSTNGKLTVANSVRIGFGETDTVLPGTNYTLEVNGSFAAITKSFVIDHPTKPDMKLRYGSLEGPENGVYVRGRLSGTNIIKLPDYWTGLIDPESITVNLTAVGKKQDLWIDDIKDNTVVVGGEEVDCFYTVYAERVDVEKLVVEFNKEQ